MTDHRTAVVRARVTPLRSTPPGWPRLPRPACRPPACCGQAMARTRTWTAAAAEVERERTRQIVRIGNNLNQIARWANAQAKPIDAIAIIAHLIVHRAGDHAPGPHRRRAAGCPWSEAVSPASPRGACPVRARPVTPTNRPGVACRPRPFRSFTTLDHRRLDGTRWGRRADR